MFGIGIRFAQFHVFKFFVVPCFDVRYDLRIKDMFGLYLLQFDLFWDHVWFMLFVFIYWCSTRFPY
jgi:hypothetical protein